MDDLLRDLPVLALDCQAAGASPAYGDLLEIGWAVCGGGSEPARGYASWVLPRTERRIPRAVRELTGWTEAANETAVDEGRAWALIRDEVDRLAAGRSPFSVPTVIHYARFELGFLRDLHARLDGSGAFPFDVTCVHAIAARLFPDLPRRSIRALAGHLGHSPELIRRCEGHVAATAHIWRSLVPRLENEGVATWTALKAWLATTSPGARPKKRTFPLPADRRRALPDRPGVYRFVRPSGDVIYVGKATSLKRRVSSHFKGTGPTTERGLELLSQVHDIVHTETPSVLEAALLETDEIKRLDPPYNVQLRSLDRAAWFASRDLRDTRTAPDDEHRIGPLPSERALASLSALVELVDGVTPSDGLRARALAVPSAFGPEASLFDAGWSAFTAELLPPCRDAALRRVARAALALWQARGHAEPGAEVTEDAAPDPWDLARVRRRLERALVQGGLLVRRARLLALVADSVVAYRERPMNAARALVIARGAIAERHDLNDLAAIASLPVRRVAPRLERQRAFDAAAYDRLRVLVTELRRVTDDGGQCALRVGKHLLDGARFARLLEAV